MAAGEKSDLEALVWAICAAGAAANFMPPEEEDQEGDEEADPDEVLDDMVDSSVKFADQMLVEFRDRFGGSSRRRRK